MNQPIEAELKQFVSQLIHKYCTESNIESFIADLAPNITLVGGREIYLNQFEDIVSYCYGLKSFVPECEIVNESYFIKELSQGIYLCDGIFYIYNKVDSDTTFQKATLIVENFDGIWKCSYISFTLPNQGNPLSMQFENPEEVISKDADIEAQKRAHARLMQKSHQMQVILDAIQGGLKVSRDDELYSYAYVSDEVCKMFGYTKEEFMKMSDGTAVGAVYPPDLPRVLRECEEAFQNGNMEYAIKYRIACKDGSLKWIIDSGKKVKNVSGEIIINSLYLDVTDMEEATLKIKEQKELLDSIYDSIMCGIVRYYVEDDSFAYVSMNQEALRILGYETEQECLDRGIEVFYSRIHPDDRDIVLNKIIALKNPGERFSYEYRIQPPEKEAVWIYGTTELLLDENGKTIIQRVMIDITEKKQLELALEEERQRFRIAMESTPAIIFEYNIPEDKYSAYGTLEERQNKHDIERVIPNFLKEQARFLVKKEYFSQFCSLLRGNEGKEIIAQMATYAGSKEFVWAKLVITPLYDDNNNFTKVIGRISNIQSEKEKEFALEAAKSRDGLTGLYTKDVGIRMVKEYMENKSPDQVCGMMLLDMDDFEKMNEEEGSVFADAILQEVAIILKNETGEDDIQIRLGGDEFMLFVKDCTKARATVLGPRIAGLVGNIFSQEKQNFKVSVSIGMCVTAVVDEYSGLYRCAESTLKYVKENARGQAACYLDTSNELGMVLTQLYTEKHFINEINQMTNRGKEDLTSFALELLGKAKNLDDAISLLLSRIGKTYHFDRVSIIEMDHDYLSYQFTYQWAKNPMDLQVGKDFYVSQEELKKIISLYNDEGFSETIIDDSGIGVAACLHGAVWNQGMYAGALSFRVNDINYVWSWEEKKLIKEMVKIIFSFIMKARADAVSQAKTDFLSRMSHEIRTPMNAIAGMTTIAKSVVGDRGKVLECLSKIESANIYLLSLINDILDMSRIESGKIEINYENISLNQQIDDLFALLKPQADAKNIRLVLENSFHEGRKVIADALRLNQVLVNIVGNAIKFTKPQGRITVKVEPLNETDENVLIRFSIRDTGIGIEKEALSRIFNAFEQAGKNTASSYGGTGLGLSISSRLVQMMGGTLEVSSEFGKGSEFYFTLLFSYGDNTVPKKEGQKKRIEQIDFRGKRILLAEDNELNREIAVTILEMNGFEVETAVDGKKVLDSFASHEPNYFDAILMDIRMPILDGLEATKRIRTMGKKDSRTIPIIAMTANAFDEDTKKSMESGMNGHLSKPIEIEKLLDTLSECFVKS